MSQPELIPLWETIWEGRRAGKNAWGGDSTPHQRIWCHHTESNLPGWNHLPCTMITVIITDVTCASLEVWNLWIKICAATFEQSTSVIYFLCIVVVVQVSLDETICHFGFSVSWVDGPRWRIVTRTRGLDRILSRQEYVLGSNVLAYKQASFRNDAVRDWSQSRS